MSSHVIKVPDVGEGVAEVELVAWTVSVGESVSRNQVLAEVMTDKANVEIPAPVEGVIASLHGDPGQVLAVGSELIELAVAGSAPGATGAEGAPAAPPAVPAPASSPAAATEAVEPVSVEGAASGGPGADPGARAGMTPFPRARGAATPATPAAPGPPTSSPTPGPAPKASPNRTPHPILNPTPSGPMPARLTTGGDPAALQPASALPRGERRRAAPAVRRRAADAGVDLDRVTGSGPAGRVTHVDLDRHLAAVPSSPPIGGPAAGVDGPASEGEVTVEPLIGLRRRIARRMVAATTTIPHITYVDEVDVTALEDLRTTLNRDRTGDAPRLTLLPFLIRAIATQLPRFPVMNAHLDDESETLTLHHRLHVGIATQTDQGLVVAVVHDADGDDVWTLASRIAEVTTAARDRRATPAQLSGSTLTITSLGALGGLVTTPVINKPEVAIVGVNKIVTRPVWDQVAFVPRQVMNLSSSFDHRVVDGWDAASFVQGIRTVLEQPALLFLEQDSGQAPG